MTTEPSTCKNQAQKVNINSKVKAAKTLVMRDVSIWQIIRWSHDACYINVVITSMIIGVQRTIRYVDLLDAPHSGGVTLDELNALGKLRQILRQIIIVDLKSLEQQLWGDGGGDFSQCVCMDTHGSAWRYKEAQMKEALHLVVDDENYGMG